TVELAKNVVGCGNTSGRDVDKFKKFGLTALAASSVRAPLIDECYASLECKVIDTKLVTQYGIFILEVVKAWIDPSNKHPRTIHHQGKGKFAVDGETIKLPSKMKYRFRHWARPWPLHPAIHLLKALVQFGSGGLDESLRHSVTDFEGVVLQALHYPRHKLPRRQIGLEVSPLGAPAWIEFGINGGRNN